MKVRILHDQVYDFDIISLQLKSNDSFEILPHAMNGIYNVNGDVILSLQSSEPDMIECKIFKALNSKQILFSMQGVIIVKNNVIDCMCITK